MQPDLSVAMSKSDYLKGWFARIKKTLLDKSSKDLLTELLKYGEEIGAHQNESAQDRSFSVDYATIAAAAIMEIMTERSTPAYHFPEPGDHVETTAIQANLGKTTTNAIVRSKIRDGNVQIIYGIYGDRALVPATSCRFVRKGTLAGTDLDDNPPFF
jgi:hypothetical protein